MNPNPGIAAVPLRSIAPTKRSAKKWERKTNSSRNKNHPFVSQPRRPKECKDKPSTPKKPKKQSNLGPNVEKKNTDFVDEEAGFDFSKVPPPFCSCSGISRRCYKYGPGGWQSTCCTNSLCEYPLPFRARKPGKRVTGRKMRGGAFRKLLCRLAREGHDLLAQPVDLKDHWARLEWKVVKNQKLIVMLHEEHKPDDGTGSRY